MTQKKNSSVTCKKMTSVDGNFTLLTQSHDTGKMRMKVMANMMMIMVMVMMIMIIITMRNDGDDDNDEDGFEI